MPGPCAPTVSRPCSCSGPWRIPAPPDPDAPVVAEVRCAEDGLAGSVPGRLGPAHPWRRCFLGVLREGQVFAFRWGTPGPICVPAEGEFEVDLAYAPPMDTLRLEAAGHVAVGSNGQAHIAFRTTCPVFVVRVEAGDIAVLSAFDLGLRRTE